MRLSSKNIEVKTMTLKADAVPKETNPNDVKFGITTPFRESDKGELVFLPHDKPVFFAVESVCRTWGYTNASDYALKFSEPPGHYVTEATRKTLSGKLVSMQYSCAKVCGDIIAKLKSNSDKEIIDGLVKLAGSAADPTVADVFVGNDGLLVLLELMEKDKPSEWFKEGFGFGLHALLDIMLLSSEATWDKLHPALISKLAYVYINIANFPLYL